MYQSQKIIRPHDKYKELRSYMSSGNKFFRKDIIKMGFNRVDVTLYNYCNRTKLKIRKVNDEYWERDDKATLIDILPRIEKNRKKRLARISNKKSRERSKLKRLKIENLPN